MTMDISRLNLFFLILGIEFIVTSSQMCTDPGRFGDDIQNGKRRLGAKIKTIEDVGLVQCMKICVQYSFCTSINFMNSKCILLSGENLVVESQAGSITSEKKKWPIERIAGNCKNHNCSNNSMCIETSKGFSCQVIGCVDPPTDYTESKVFGQYTIWVENVSVAIPCEEKDRCTHIFTCQKNGLWSNITYFKERQSPSCLGEWTEWFSRDTPDSTGDHENVDDILQEYPGRLCSDPTAIDARVKGDETNHLWGDMFFYSLSIGLKCFNQHQFDGKCDDYEVKFCC